MMKRSLCVYHVFLTVLGLCLFSGDGVHAGAYDPTKIEDGWSAEMADLSITDAQRQREIPLRIYLPSKQTPSPVVLFSHGLGGSRKNNANIGNHWSGRGYVVVFVQHHGSDEQVWKDKAETELKAALEQAASLQNFILRAKDIPVVLNALEKWSDDQDHILHNRLDLTRVGMSGHSFGAITTQAVSGQCMIGGKPLLTDPRIKAAVALSPSSPPFGSAQAAFGKVNIPWLLMTGTKDVIWIGNIDLQSRLAVYQGLPPGEKYEVVLYNAEHSAFHEGPLPGDKEKRNPNHHRAMLALSTAFWDTYLRQDGTAKEWLDGDGPRSVLEPKDSWKKK